MLTTIALPSPSDRHPKLTYENHPRIGDYIFHRDSWTQRRQLQDGKRLLLSGRGRKPTDEQISLFEQIDAHLPELTAGAIETIPPPPMEAISQDSPRLSQEEFVIAEVRLELDLTFALFFDTPTGDRINLWPMVRFSGWRVVDSEWVP